MSQNRYFTALSFHEEKRIHKELAIFNIIYVRFNVEKEREARNRKTNSFLKSTNKNLASCSSKESILRFGRRITNTNPFFLKR